MRQKLVDRIVGGVVFAYAFVLYLLTVAPTVSFWDAGEFIASVHGLEVMHPPGAPFYMLLGRLSSMFVPTEYVALSVNLISVLASAGVVLLTHLTIVRLVRTWQPPLAEQSFAGRFAALAGGVIGACAFAVTDSFWFNAVEAEVYALSMFFTAAVVWLIMRWAAEARAEEERLRGGQGHHLFGLASNRYLVLIAYFFGLAIGVHLLNLLAFFFVALIIFFTEYDRPEWSTQKRWGALALTGVVAALVFLLIYPGVVQGLPEMAEAFGAPLFFFILLFAAIAFAVYYTHTRGMQRANLLALCVAMILIGYSAYALIFIRSATDPPIDLNNPETSDAFVSYLKREQYGATPLLRGQNYDNETGGLSEEEKLFPRRYSPRANHRRVYARYDSDWQFFWQYQVGHMYLRYFLWNFSGRAGDVQGARSTAGPPPAEQVALQTPSERAGYNYYFALPLLLGLFGMLYHFFRDWRRAFSVGVLFLITGFGIIVYLNQTPMQPRERDYSYVASFFAFCLWIGVGASGLLELAAGALRERLGGLRRGAMLGVGGLLFLAVPFLMAFQNYDDHDRSGNYVAADYGYNMLQSVEPGAILFTNGDNDTYPLWYLQEVEGVRTDVRVVNLSLLQTPWYVRQLKNQRAGKSAPLPISLSENQIDNLQAKLWQPKKVQLPVEGSHWTQTPEGVLFDTSRVKTPMTWTLQGRPYRGQYNILYPNDLVAYNILRTNAENGWKRPVYFATTASRSAQLNLQNYLQLEGQALRVAPIRHNNPLGRVSPLTAEHMEQFRFRDLDDPGVYYNSVVRQMVDGYRLWFAEAAQQLARRGDVQAARALVDTLSAKVPFSIVAGDAQSHLLMAQAQQAVGNTEAARRLMREAEETALTPGDVRSYLSMAQTYQRLGDTTRALELGREVEPMILQRLQQAGSNRGFQQAARQVQQLRYLYMQAGQFQAAADFSNDLAEATGDDALRQNAQELRQVFEGASAPGGAPLPSTAPDSAE